MSKASEYQPKPQPGQQVVLDALQQDISERANMGYIKHGTLLMTYNGRDALWDAYQEVIDAAFYLKQALLERENGQ
jgi:hypothetical protein